MQCRQPENRQVRVVAFSDQAKAAFERLRERENFTSRDDHVYCTAAGAPLDRANVRKRFFKARKQPTSTFGPPTTCAIHLVRWL